MLEPVVYYIGCPDQIVVDFKIKKMEQIIQKYLFLRIEFLYQDVLGRIKMPSAATTASPARGSIGWIAPRKTKYYYYFLVWVSYACFYHLIKINFSSLTYIVMEKINFWFATVTKKCSGTSFLMDTDLLMTNANFSWTVDDPVCTVEKIRSN